ncbi:hypothetical protein BC831DRAFT_237683 [Entophlyctis helioformis]|nr:hypothetical protein BC831DRAFT_237683 [Entophlyctis helioformis]
MLAMCTLDNDTPPSGSRNIDVQALTATTRGLLSQGRYATLVHTLLTCWNAQGAAACILAECNKFLSLAFSNRQHSDQSLLQPVSFFACFLSRLPLQLFVQTDHTLQLQLASIMGLLIRHAPVAVLQHGQKQIRHLLRSSSDAISHAILSSLLAVLKCQIGERKHELHWILIEAKIAPLLLHVAAQSRTVRAIPDQGSPHLALEILHDISRTDHLRPHLGTETFIRNILQVIPQSRPSLLILLLKIIKNLCQCPELLGVIATSDSVRCFCNLLWRQNSRVTNDIQTQSLCVLSCLTKMNVGRQEQAVDADIGRHLSSVALSGSTARQYAIPILCEIVRGSKKCRDSLWACGAPAVLATLVMDDVVWRTFAFEAILFW